MTHRHQAGASAEAMAAENIALARTIARLAATLRTTTAVLSFDNYDPYLVTMIDRVLDRERDVIERAAAVWPPVERDE